MGRPVGWVMGCGPEGAGRFHQADHQAETEGNPSVRCLDCLAAMSGPIVFVYRHPHRYKALDCVIATVVEIQIPDPSTHASDLDSGWDQGLLKGCLGLVLEHHEVSSEKGIGSRPRARFEVVSANRLCYHLAPANRVVISTSLAIMTL